MPLPKDPVKLQQYKEKQREIALEKGFGKWMKGRVDTPFLKASKEYTKSIKGKTFKEHITHICEYCKKEFKTYPYQTAVRYCSRACYLESPERVKEYSLICKKYWLDKPKKYEDRPYQGCNGAYSEWRTAVFKRDNFTCQSCGSKGYIEGHHVKSWSKFPELRYEVSNGLSLCKECHKEANRVQRSVEKTINKSNYVR